MNLGEAQQALQIWMIQRGWHRLQGKRDPFRQSLLAHALCQVNVVAALAPFLTDPQGAAFQDEDLLVLLAAVASHDVGKETEAWQAYIAEPTLRVEHVDPSLAERTAEELGELLGVKQVAEVVSGITLHMAATSGAGDVLIRGLTGGHTNFRWRELAEWAAQIDNLCSAPDVDQALAETSRSGGVLGRYLKWARHRVATVRGISTTLLHRAAMDAYEGLGWVPLLSYADGTLYAAALLAGPTEPPATDIAERAAALFQRALDEVCLVNEVVGSPIADIFPKPEYFDSRLMRQYLQRALGKSKSANFRKKTPEDIQKIRVRLGVESAHDEHVLRDIPDENADLQQVLAVSAPIAEAFRFFKAVFCTDKLTRWPAEWIEALEAEFDALFGVGAFQALRGLSTLMPARDYLLTRRFFQLATPDDVPVSSLPEAKQGELCVELLTGLAEAVLRRARESEQLSQLDGSALARAFLPDLLTTGDPDAMLESYAQSKVPGRGLAKLCPVTNEISVGGLGAGADLGLNREAHTNRWPMQRVGIGSVPVSTAMRQEMMLRRFVLGGVPDRILALVPPVQLGRDAGQEFVERALTIATAFDGSGEGESASPTRRYSLGMTARIAQVLGRTESEDVPGELLDLLVYTVSPAKQSEHRKRLKSALLEFTRTAETTEKHAAEREALGILNGEFFRTPYTTFDEAVEALYLGTDESVRRALEDPDLAACRAQALNLRAPARIVCRTPHAFYLLIQGQIGLNPKEKEASRAVRELLLLVLFATRLGASAAILDQTESLTFSGGEGSVRLPLNAAFRQAVFSARRRLLARRAGVGFGRGDVTRGWLSAGELGTWLRVVTAVHRLADLKNERDQPVFEPNNGLYDVLSARSAGALLRQVEYKAGAFAVARALPHVQVLEPIL